jgi:hypothetical protein
VNFLEDKQERLLCVVCSLPIDLKIDRYADDDGRPIHERCYLKKLAPSMSEETAASLARMMQSGSRLVSFKT